MQKPTETANGNTAGKEITEVLIKDVIFEGLQPSTYDLVLSHIESDRSNTSIKLEDKDSGVQW